LELYDLSFQILFVQSCIEHMGLRYAPQGPKSDPSENGPRQN
jgi:hypothetical protein